VFAGMWHIVQNSNIKFSELFVDIDFLPYTFSYLIRKRMQIDSWMENLPKKHRPPESIWDDAGELEEWFERIYSEEAQTEFNIDWNENEVEE
jgi:hypothetical protein